MWRSQAISGSTAQQFKGVSVFEHQNYRPGTSNDFDIAVVRLPSPLTYNDYVQPVCMPHAPVADRTECVVTGWGDTQGIYNNRFLCAQMLYRTYTVNLHTIGWFRGSVVERWSLTGELSLSCARPTADGWPLRG